MVTSAPSFHKTQGYRIGRRVWNTQMHCNQILNSLLQKGKCLNNTFTPNWIPLHKLRGCMKSWWKWLRSLNSVIYQQQRDRIKRISYIAVCTYWCCFTLIPSYLCTASNCLTNIKIASLQACPQSKLSKNQRHIMSMKAISETVMGDLAGFKSSIFKKAVGELAGV